MNYIEKAVVRFEEKYLEEDAANCYQAAKRGL